MASKTETEQTATRRRRNVAIEGMDLEAAKRHLARFAQEFAIVGGIRSDKAYSECARLAADLHAKASALK